MTVEVRIPQLGEGLQEARIVRFLKQPGDTIRQDEPIYEMETDKAVMEIESPAAGVLQAWTAHEDDVLPIGAVVGRVATDTEVSLAAGSELRVSLAPAGETLEAEAAFAAGAPTAGAGEPRTLRNTDVPPRTRAYAREKGLSDDDLALLASRSAGKLLPADIDAYLSTQHVSPGTLPVAYTDSPLPPRQRALAYHLQRSAQNVVQATMEMPVDWGAVEAARTRLRERGELPEGRLPSHFLLFAWCVAQTAPDFPRFRSALVNDTTLRTYERLQLGIAVARSTEAEEDELLTARVQDADAMDLGGFAAAAQQAIERARAGEDQSSDVMQLTVTNLASAGVRLGIPVVVAPAVGTLFIGAAYDEAYPQSGGGIGFRRVAQMALTFDHRVANGAGAARFLGAIRGRVAALQDEF